MENKSTIIEENGTYRYFDKNSTELHDGDVIVRNNGKEEKLYLTEDGMLGTDATNPHWIEIGRAEPCEYGIYPLKCSDLAEAHLKEDHVVQTNIGTMPIEDYREIIAIQSGFDSYDDMYSQGGRLGHGDDRYPEEPCEYTVTDPTTFQKLCIQQNWFTCGSNAQYDKLFYANSHGCPIEEIATIIWVCSDDNVRRSDVLDTLRAEQEKYLSFSVRSAEQDMER